MEEKILYLPLKKKWYEMIESGEKPEEYREDKRYWRRRLYKGVDWSTGEFKDFTHVVFTYGYTRRRMKWQIKKMLKKFGNPAWGAPTDKMVITIVLGERVE